MSGTSTHDGTGFSRPYSLKKKNQIRQSYGVVRLTIVFFYIEQPAVRSFIRVQLGSFCAVRLHYVRTPTCAPLQLAHWLDWPCQAKS